MRYNNILFIHCPKNGGTYIQEVIFKYRSNVVKSQYNYFGNKFKKNYHDVPYILKVLIFIITFFVYHEHFTLQQYSRKYDLRKLEILFVCRNPYDRLLSSYNFLNFSGDFNSFLDKIESCRKSKSSLRFIYIDPMFYAHSRNQTDYIKFNKSIYPRVHIIPLENKGKLKHFCNLNNLNYETQKINLSKKRRTILTLSEKERIYRIFKEDFDYFGYPK